MLIQIVHERLAKLKMKVGQTENGLERVKHALNSD